MQLKVNAFNNSTGREREILVFFWANVFCGKNLAKYEIGIQYIIPKFLIFPNFFSFKEIKRTKVFIFKLV